VTELESVVGAVRDSPIFRELDSQWAAEQIAKKIFKELGINPDAPAGTTKFRLGLFPQMLNAGGQLANAAEDDHEVYANLPKHTFTRIMEQVRDFHGD
jgi:hypothetical protein